MTDDACISWVVAYSRHGVDPRPQCVPRTKREGDMSEHESKTDHDRRRLIGMGTAAAAGAVVGLVATADPASATTGTMQYGTTNNAGADQTSLTASTGFDGLVVVNSGSGGGIFGQGSQF